MFCTFEGCKNQREYSARVRFIGKGNRFLCWGAKDEIQVCGKHRKKYGLSNAVNWEDVLKLFIKHKKPQPNRALSLLVWSKIKEGGE